MQAIIQILKLNEIRTGKSANGKDWTMQDAECLLLNDDGSVGEVGVLQVPRDLLGKVSLGTFTARFALRANKGREGGRRIEAVLTALAPVPPAAFKASASVPAAGAAK